MLRDPDLPTRGDEMFCFAVYAASHAINRAYSPLLKRLDLTYPQYIALTFLWERDGRAVGDLAACLRMETSTLTPLLKRLEKRGHVIRRRGTRDERQVFVHLTESGCALQDEAPAITSCMIQSTALSLAELDALVETLTRLTSNLQAVAGPGEAAAR